ncbi:urate hydroxylase PuuD [Thiohalophilus sp.]|uniref:urate hydroxylase PuuD n=1 Tax=Thiohalophilus sp. TaxID=3028392 RepID=UPI002ACD94BA|nr:urate hydroxylase PuuD [Thiohalophilus sp.]MDZ7663619.1 urate hydroxylase PuuD [Thiohalophilus sp.]
MNPLKSITGTIVSGIILSIIIIFVMGRGGAVNPLEFWVWVHVLVGIAWIGLLYYFNFVQVPAQAVATADSDGPGPAAIGKYVAPLALLWFRWAAVATWITGALALEALHTADGSGFVAAFTFQQGYQVIGMGAWLGTIMLFNVWVLIWPNQKKVLGLVEASDAEKAKAKFIALMASRTNTLLSIPMILGMTGHMHGMPF